MDFAGFLFFVVAPVIVTPFLVPMQFMLVMSGAAAWATPLLALSYVMVQFFPLINVIKAGRDCWLAHLAGTSNQRLCTRLGVAVLIYLLACYICYPYQGSDEVGVITILPLLGSAIGTWVWYQLPRNLREAEPNVV